MGLLLMKGAGVTQQGGHGGTAPTREIENAMPPG